MSGPLEYVLDDVRTLLELPADATGRARHEVEEILTTGYAHALHLERERLRLEKLLRDADAPPHEQDLRGRLESAESELARVRELLASLRAHALG